MSGLGREVRARAIIGGDATEAAISAASILAKTARDHYMNQMHAIYPEYAFDTHKGYGTLRHRRQLALYGPCPLHRRSFAPVSALADSLDASMDWEDEDLRDIDPDLELDPDLDFVPGLDSSPEADAAER